MKIGILTYHCADNYGAVLQAYATQAILKKNGYDAEIIDYRPSYLLQDIQHLFKERLEKSKYFSALKLVVATPLILPWRFARKRKFASFRKKYLKLSQVCKPEKKLESFASYDAIIFGSDQIWNPKINYYDPLFFGFLPIDMQIKKIAYAASMETTNLDQIDISFFSSAMDNFYFISVREKHLCNLLQQFSHKKIEEVLDPTLLLTAKDWNKIAIEPKIETKYVLAYSMGDSSNVLKVAKRIAKQISAKVVCLSSSAGIFYDEGLHYSLCASPAEFIGWFKNADFVVTSSFHGTSFAMIFNKPFYSIKKMANENSRQISLLSNVQLLSCFKQYSESLDYFKLDYTKPQKKLDDLRKKSISFLTKAIR